MQKAGTKVSFGVDSVGVLRLIDEVFGEAKEVAELLVEIEVGENRSGVIEEGDFRALMSAFKECKNVKFCGVFSHDGHSYKAKNKRECEQIFK
ncbi:alanine racemase [Campylobacter concisus]